MLLNIHLNMFNNISHILTYSDIFCNANMLNHAPDSCLLPSSSSSFTLTPWPLSTSPIELLNHFIFLFGMRFCCALFNFSGLRETDESRNLLVLFPEQSLSTLLKKETSLLQIVSLFQTFLGFFRPLSQAVCQVDLNISKHFPWDFIFFLNV